MVPDAGRVVQHGAGGQRHLAMSIILNILNITIVISIQTIIIIIISSSSSSITIIHIISRSIITA